MQASGLFWATVLSITAVGTSFSTGKGSFRLRILHTNDMHARFEQVSQSAGKCSEYEAINGLCYGGFARVQGALLSEFERARAENVSVLSLNAGDTYQGTVWYAVYKWQVVSHFLKMLRIDAMCLGNHEFDDGVKNLVPFLNDVKIPVLSSNINLTGEPEMAKAPIQNHLVLEKEGRRVGIIGYLTPETVTLADTGKLTFSEEIATLKKEAKFLKNSGVNVIIALGHSGYEVDLKIAREVPDVDVVVGGHSHTFLYSGKPPDSDVPADRYPVMVIQPSGRKVAMVQAYAFTKYLGVLDLTFDNSGELVAATGNPILLNSKVKEDPTVLSQVKEWQKKLSSSLKFTLATTKVYFDGFRCRFYECNLGNLITDAYIHYVAKKNPDSFWTDAAIAIQQAGGIRAPINATGSNGNITREDIITAMPFFSPLSVVRIQGRRLLEALEWSVARYDPNRIQARGEFLQVSGLRIKFNLLRPVGYRVVFVEARCSQCIVPRFKRIVPEMDYNVIMPTFIFKGGDNFTMFQKFGKEIRQLDISDTEVVMTYAEEKKLLYHGEEHRIELVEEMISSASSFKISIITMSMVLLGRFV